MFSERFIFSEQVEQTNYLDLNIELAPLKISVYNKTDDFPFIVHLCGHTQMYIPL